MFTLAILIGIYSYSIFLLGLIGYLYKQVIITITIFFVLIIIFFICKNHNVYKLKGNIVNFIRKYTRFDFLLISFILLQVFVNFIGVLGPELGFDALWYHLALPKLYLINHSIDYIPGGLLYYSTIPRLTEMLYVVGLAFGSEVYAKLIHFSFGILSLIALYKLSARFFSIKWALLVCIIFYSNLVVGWLSTSAYIDLSRTFFEIMALWGFLEWQEKKKTKWLITSAIMLGFAISTKLLALGTLFIFTLLIFIFIRRITSILLYLLFALLVPLPWFVFSLIHTGNPVYPFFTNIYPVKFNFNLINPLNLSDPISPLYIIFLPIAIFFYRKFKPSLKILSLYSFFAIVVWYLTPQTGGGRFILPYLPVFSIISVFIIKKIKNIKVRYIFVGLIFFYASFSIIYRSGANLKYIPVILERESKTEFLSDNLNFAFGDFYDTDGYFGKKIKEDDMVLLYGFHNLFYVNFPFVDSSYVKKGDSFNYVAVMGNNLPERFKIWDLIYYNEKTNVKLYSAGGIKWVY